MALFAISFVLGGNTVYCTPIITPKIFETK